MSALVLAPGIYDVPADTYHADPAPPSLSASICKLLCQRSPRHAWEAHPALNPEFERVEEKKFDPGTVAHAMLLEGDDICEVIDAADWRTNKAKDARDAARAGGKVPLLVGQYEQVQAMVDAARWQLEAVDAAPPLLEHGKPEQTLIWQEGDVTCRALVDWLHDDHTAIDDLKTTTGSANPADWAHRRLWDLGADIQAAFYMRGVKALTGVDPEFRFVVVESVPPYALSVVALAPSALAFARDKVNWAITTWRECLKADEWPGYARGVAYAEAPAWEEMRWLEARHYDTEASAA